MLPRLVASAASGLGGTGGDIQWNMTVPYLPRGSIVFIAGLGREENGEQNPEEINVCYFNGQYLNRILDANNQETGHGLYYYVVPVGGLAAGTYTCGINFKDSRKPAEKKRGVSCAFANLLPQAPASSTVATSGDNSASITNASTLTPVALLIVSCGWRVGFAETWGGNVTPIVTSRGDNQGGVSLAYAIVTSPTNPITVTCNCGNSESKGMVAASFTKGKDKGINFLGDFV